MKPCSHKAGLFLKTFLLLLTSVLIEAPSYGRVIDKTVAFVDNEAITLSELDSEYGKSMKTAPDISRRQVLETMINRRLLIREAKRLRLEASDEEKLIENFIEIRVRAFIRISENESKEFYEKNRAQFGDAEFVQVRGQIEQLLREKEVNAQLKKLLADLRAKAYVKVTLE